LPVDAFFSSELWPFALATVLLLAVAATEGLALLIGANPSHLLDNMIGDLDHPDGPSTALGWLHVGKVPILVIVVLFLTAFALIGFVAQLVARSTMGFFMPSLLAAGIAFVGGVAAVRTLGAALGKVMPKDESTAVSDISLVGRVGTIVVGVATAGRPAQARVLDAHGATHYVMVEPEGPHETFETGASILLVRHLRGRLFHAITNPKPGLL
jgi:YqiJ-like protein